MRVGSVLAVGAVLALLLSGCSRGQEANQTLPTASSSASAEATLEPLGPPDLPMPAEAREQTPTGAEAFIQYYMDIYNLALRDLDPTFMDQFSQGCETCDELILNLREDAESGLNYQGGLVALNYVDATIIDERSEAAFTLNQEALTVIDSTGSEQTDLSGPPASLNCGAILNWSSSSQSWLFTQWDVN
ncbi:hypothetical protein ASG36_07080 [Geodermatophilus sp. Leaf369]|nr:hypothetical protein ASG36_07080 [Geodermatophilus sp. Leaf369]